MPRQRRTPSELPMTVNCGSLCQSNSNFRVTGLHCFLPQQCCAHSRPPIRLSAKSFGSSPSCLPVCPSVCPPWLNGWRPLISHRDSCLNKTLYSLRTLKGGKQLTIHSVPWVNLFTFGIDPNHCWRTGLSLKWNEYVILGSGGGRGRDFFYKKTFKNVKIMCVHMFSLFIFQSTHQECS